MKKSLNKIVADFEHKGRKYEIDLLLDSMGGGYATYDIFDVTEDNEGKIVGQLSLEQQEEDEYMPSELIAMALEERYFVVNSRSEERRVK